eukprot:1843301-Prymnesium_polylepis.1
MAAPRAVREVSIGSCACCAIALDIEIFEHLIILFQTGGVLERASTEPNCSICLTTRIYALRGDSTTEMEVAVLDVCGHVGCAACFQQVRPAWTSADDGAPQVACPLYRTLNSGWFVSAPGFGVFRAEFLAE